MSHLGVVRKFDEQKGFGFIRPSESQSTWGIGTEDIFVHFSALPGGRGWLKEGDE